MPGDYEDLKPVTDNEFSIHIRAWGVGSIVWIIGFALVLGLSISYWYFLLLLLLILAVSTVLDNERGKKIKD